MKRSQIYLKAYNELHSYGCTAIRIVTKNLIVVNRKNFPEFFLFERRSPFSECTGWFGPFLNSECQEHRKTALYFAYVIAKSEGN